MIFVFILTDASPNALQRNKQSTPTPNRISMPLVGEWIYDKHERPWLPGPSLFENWRFPLKDKAWNASYVIMRILSARLQIYE